MEAIVKFSPEGNFKYIMERESTVNINSTSPKTALLLNFLFNKVEEDRPVHQNYSYRYGTTITPIGGGLLVKAEARVMIDNLNRITVYFNNPYAVDKYIRAAWGKTEIQKSILDKIANELKKVWNKHSVSKKLQILYKHVDQSKKGVYSVLKTSDFDHQDYLDLNGIPTVKNEKGDEFVEISFNEYRALYEYLKGRNTESIIKRDTQEAYDSMIGKQIEDQFLITAIETIENEIKNAKQLYEEQYNKARSDRENAKAELDRIFKETTAAYENEMKLKINELNAQMTEMINATKQTQIA